MLCYFGIPKLRAASAKEKCRKVVASVLGDPVYVDPQTLWVRTYIMSSINHLEGVMMEVGVNSGGASLVTGACKPRWRELHLFDTFAGKPKEKKNINKDLARKTIPAASPVKTGTPQQSKNAAAAGEGAVKGGFEMSDERRNKNQTILPVNPYLRSRFHDLDIDPDKYKVRFHHGLPPYVGFDVVYVHLDGHNGHDDSMTSLTTLARVVPLVVKGGVVVVDDYFTSRGCREAVNYYFSVTKDTIDHAESVVVEKIGRHWRLETRRSRLVIEALSLKDDKLTKGV